MTKSQKPPLLRFAVLSNRVYVVTSYRVVGVRAGEQVIVANRKFDVTHDFCQIMRDHRRQIMKANRGGKAAVK